MTEQFLQNLEEILKRAHEDFHQDHGTGQFTGCEWCKMLDMSTHASDCKLQVTYYAVKTRKIPGEGVAHYDSIDLRNYVDQLMAVIKERILGNDAEADRLCDEVNDNILFSSDEIQWFNKLSADCTEIEDIVRLKTT